MTDYKGNKLKIGDNIVRWGDFCDENGNYTEQRLYFDKIKALKTNSLYVECVGGKYLKEEVIKVIDSERAIKALMMWSKENVPN